MRLTGGEGKGRRLADAPPGVRPTSGRAKELLYQLLMDRLHSAWLLDLFAGTGALGIEALARGVDKATFVEKDRRAQAAIRDNLRRCGFESRGKLIPGDVVQMLKRPERLDGPFDIIVADPPYADEVFGAVMKGVLDNRLITPDGILMFEAASRSHLELPEGWTKMDERTVGDTSLHFFELS